MNILIAGASGFIGKELTAALLSRHHVSVVGRDMQRLSERFPSSIKKLIWSELSTHDARQYDAVINLAGSNIGAVRWNEKIKQELIESRTSTNRQLIDWLISQHANPHYYCANAVGIYGAHDDATDLYDESYDVEQRNSQDFLKQIGLAWEASLQPAIDNRIKVTTLRFGVVLKRGQGMLGKLQLPFQLCMGSVLGTGHQVISWIHHHDLIRAVIFLLSAPDVVGPVNITALHPVTQREFSVQLARILHRPLYLTTPAWVVNLLFGEMGEYLLLKGQKVVPAKLTQLGFDFTYPDIVQALEAEYRC